MDETLATARPFDIGIEEIVPLGRGRGALAEDVVRAAWTAHERELFTYARRATRDEEAAADLVQDAFLRLVSEVRAGRRPTLVRPWLYRVLTNRIVSRSRHRGVVDRWLHGQPRPEGTGSSPEGAAIADETRALLERAIATLPPVSRTALLLAASGFRGPEIAAQLGRSENATRTILCRARLQVRSILEAESHEPSDVTRETRTDG